MVVSERDIKVAANIHRRLHEKNCSGHVVEFPNEKTAENATKAILSILGEMGGNYVAKKYWTDDEGKVGYRFSTPENAY